MCQPGDLVMVPFPFSDQDVTKKRPVLVLTIPDGRGDFVGLAVTSVPTVQCALEVDNHSIIAGSLPKRSWLRIDKIFSLNTRLVEGIFAQVSPAFRFLAVQEICNILAPDAKGATRLAL
ncbi:MAG: type II toxin-antitoxin system PemK/MazF family toxin [Magnetococcales bacterium]|nr:type II toxin-antitoxin system PemK/MazF family toxin [Magnetococcales bacterium]